MSHSSCLDIQPRELRKSPQFVEFSFNFLFWHVLFTVCLLAISIMFLLTDTITIIYSHTCMFVLHSIPFSIFMQLNKSKQISFRDGSEIWSKNTAFSSNKKNNLNSSSTIEFIHSFSPFIRSISSRVTRETWSDCSREKTVYLNLWWLLVWGLTNSKKSLGIKWMLVVLNSFSCALFQTLCHCQLGAAWFHKSLVPLMWFVRRSTLVVYWILVYLHLACIFSHSFILLEKKSFAVSLPCEWACIHSECMFHKSEVSEWNRNGGRYKMERWEWRTRKSRNRNKKGEEKRQRWNSQRPEWHSSDIIDTDPSINDSIA